MGLFMDKSKDAEFAHQVTTESNIMSNNIRLPYPDNSDHDLPPIFTRPQLFEINPNESIVGR